MKLSDFPPEKARDWLWTVIDRHHASKERNPFRVWKTQVHLDVEEARLIYAAWKWLERYETWVAEAGRAKGKVGVWPAQHGLPRCVQFLGEIVAGLSEAEQKVITVTEVEMEILRSSSEHLDHYAILMAADRKSGGGRKGKR